MKNRKKKAERWKLVARRILDTGHWILGTGYWILKWIMDTEYWIPDADADR